MPEPCKRVLVVEDDPLSAELFQVILRDRGYEALIAENAAGALVPFANGDHFDLVLLDVRLPGMSGPQLRETLKTMRPTLKIVYVSGTVDTHPDGENGTTPVVRKPFQIQTLVDAVRREIGEP